MTFRVARHGAVTVVGVGPELSLRSGGDVKAAAKWGVWGAFYTTGQACVSVERVYVHERIYDEFVAAVRAVIAAAYDFKVVRVSGQYQVAEQGNGLEDNEYAIGVTMPLGAFELSAGYAMGKSELSGVTTEEGKAFAFGATYALSKRTKLYGGYLDGEVENGVGTVTTDRRAQAIVDVASGKVTRLTQEGSAHAAVPLADGSVLLQTGTPPARLVVETVRFGERAYPAASVTMRVLLQAGCRSPGGARRA